PRRRRHRHERGARRRQGGGQPGASAPGDRWGARRGP
ncbi:MAG: hypothetical protein KDA94_03535, partial [Acidimicrobiales bacterium]|nr:hypothetical protein [Acidimicrobiales bacterium]